MFVLLVGSVLCDVGGQVAFKLGLHARETPRRGVLGFIGGLVRSPWIVAGVLIYALEFVCWYGALTLAPLSLAMPFAALSYCGVVIASRLILRERVPPRRWLATLVVAAGVAIVVWPAA